jgi:hypothetical protein
MAEETLYPLIITSKVIRNGSHVISGLQLECDKVKLKKG